MEDALLGLLATSGLEHLQQPLGRLTLGSLLLRCENRLGLLNHLKGVGVDNLQDRQRVANALAKLKRTTQFQAVDPAGPHPVLGSESLLAEYGQHCGSIGLLLLPDGSVQHVNEEPADYWGSHTFSVGLQQPKLDGPIVAEIARLAQLVGCPVYYPFMDEDPFVVDPMNAFARVETLCDDEKLSHVRRVLGERVLVLTTAAVRGITSAPRCVGLIPAYDSWAAPEDSEKADRWLCGLHRQPLNAGTVYANRLDKAVWRGARTGGREGSSLRSQVVAYCHGKRWADVQFVPDMHSRGMSGETMLGGGELTRVQQAGYKILLCVDGNTWASSWEWALASGSVIIYLGVWHLHLMASLEPYVHFVPCTSVSELEQQVTWVLDHPTEATQITRNAYALFRRVATPEHTRKCVLDVLTTLAEMAHEDSACTVELQLPSSELRSVNSRGQ